MNDIIPALLPKDEEDLEKQLTALPPEAIFFHMDVLEQDIWKETNRNFEVHLMVNEPGKIVGRWVERGAKRIIVHKIDEHILKYRKQIEIGLGFELQIPIEDVLALATFADFVHIMSISDIGAQGHPLDERVFDRIKQVQENFPNLPISVDGGITVQNYQKLF